MVLVSEGLKSDAAVQSVVKAVKLVEKDVEVCNELLRWICSKKFVRNQTL